MDWNKTDEENNEIVRKQVEQIFPKHKRRGSVFDWCLFIFMVCPVFAAVWVLAQSWILIDNVRRKGQR